ncbi:glycosyltransferase family A protein [Pollutibacter soli]|uniref:glycosyltransferase family 2 protein n=1 Tax=Pollutibacter soli TaxID=3034157 RepID=UPI0030134C0B
MSVPLVSVLMTAYNREKYIGAAIESVRASTFENWELIVVDDRSSDKTVDIVKKISESDSRVKLHINEKNLGDYPNRNRAAELASGKYLKYVDADDYIYPWGLQLLVEAMEKYSDAGWGLCSLHQSDKAPFPFILSPREAYLYHYKGPGLFHKAPLSSIIRRDVFQQVNGFREIRMAGDFDMWHRLAKQFPVVLMPHGIVWYRRHGEQEVKDYEKYLDVYESLRKEHLLDHSNPLSGEMRQEISADLKNKYKKQAMRSFVKMKLSAAKRYMRFASAWK